MFEISYRFLDEEISDISNLSSQDFDSRYGDITGQIELNFNGNKIGLYHQEIPFGNELILLWFNLLHKVARGLRASNYIGWNLLGNNNRLEFIKEEDILKINYIESDSKLGVSKFIVNNPISDIKRVIWKDNRIKFDQFISEIIEKTSNLLDDLKMINSNLINSNKVIAMTKFLNDELSLE